MAVGVGDEMRPSKDDTCTALCRYSCSLSDAVSLSACTVDSDSSPVSVADIADVSERSSLDQPGMTVEAAAGEPLALAGVSSVRCPRCTAGVARTASSEGSH